MKRIVPVLVLMITLFTLVACATASSSASIDESERWYSIDHYSITAVMDEAGMMSVKEAITANFNGEYHGIVRTIPTSNDIRDIACSTEFSTGTENGSFLIRMGSASKLVSGAVEYKLDFFIDTKWTGGEFRYILLGDWDVDVTDLTFSFTVPATLFTGENISLYGGNTTGKVLETVDVGNGKLLIKGTISVIPAHESLVLIIK